MRTTKLVRFWDREKADFVHIPVQCPLDSSLSCKECRYFNDESESCLGIGSTYYQRKIPYPEFVPRNSECTVRLPPELFAFV